MDAVIIGGGLTGITTAYLLKKFGPPPNLVIVIAGCKIVGRWVSLRWSR